jgi:predicted RNA-binding protein with PIN domain
MPLLIDGYNLLHVSGVFGTGTALTELHRSREALLAFLASSLEPADRKKTTIVFDAAGAPPGLPDTFSFEGILVRFAREPGNADAMLEALIEIDKSPRTLVVVSGDHRVQRAARRRRAKPIDSDRWWADLCAERRRRGADSPKLPQKPTTVNLTESEVDYWVRQFADAPPEEIFPASKSPKKSDTKRRSNSRPSKRPTDTAADLDNPFPPGYGEDLLET